MNGTSGFQEVRSSTSRQPHIASATSNGTNSEEDTGTFSALSISSLSPQASAQTEKRFQNTIFMLSHKYWFISFWGTAKNHRAPI